MSSFLLQGHEYHSSPTLSYWQFDPDSNELIGPVSTNSKKDTCGDLFYETNLSGEVLKFAVYNAGDKRVLLVNNKTYHFHYKQVLFKSSKYILFERFEIIVNGETVVDFTYILPFWRSFLADSMITEFIYPLRYAQYLFDNNLLAEGNSGTLNSKR